MFVSHSEAGFVASYVTEGCANGLLFQIVAELRRRLPLVLGACRSTTSGATVAPARGVGVRSHTDGSCVTLNLWLTPDQSHPEELDWAVLDRRKDDPEIQNLFAAYLSDTHAEVVPYRYNRAVLFDSRLLHQTDPFRFRDDYLGRRMNLTVLFGRPGQTPA